MKIEDQIKVLEDVYGIRTHYAVDHIKKQQALKEAGVALPFNIYMLEPSPIIDWHAQLVYPYREIGTALVHVRTVGARRPGARRCVHKFSSFDYVVYVREEETGTLIAILTREEDDAL